MKVSVVKKEGSRVSLEVEAPETVVDEAYGKAYKNVVKRVNIPGFRKGKAPRNIVERYYGVETLKEEAIRETLPDQYIEAVKESGIQPVDDPEFDDIEFDQGKPLKFTAVVDVRPEVQLGDYKTLSVPFEAPSVTDEEVDRQFELLRDRMAELRPLGEDAVLQLGNYANCHVKGLEGGDTALAEMDDELTYIEVGKEFSIIPGLSQALLGMKTGESKEFTGEYPARPDKADQEPTEETPGDDTPGETTSQTLRFLVTVKEIYEKRLPEAEEFLKTIGHSNVLEAKADLKRRIINMRLDMARRQHTDEVETKVVEMSSVEIPRAMINRKAQDILDRFANRLKESGTDLDGYMKSSGKSVEDLRADIERQAQSEVKSELVLDALADKEDIKVSEESVDQVVGSLAQQAGSELGAMKTTLELRGALDGLRRDLARVEALRNLSIEAAVKAGTPIPENEPQEAKVPEPETEAPEAETETPESR